MEYTKISRVVIKGIDTQRVWNGNGISPTKCHTIYMPRRPLNSRQRIKGGHVEDITRLSNKCYFEGGSLPKSRKTSVNLKNKMYVTLIRPIVLYDSET